MTKIDATVNFQLLGNTLILTEYFWEFIQNEHFSSPEYQLHNMDPVSNTTLLEFDQTYQVTILYPKNDRNKIIWNFNLFPTFVSMKDVGIQSGSSGHRMKSLQKLEGSSYPHSTTASFSMLVYVLCVPRIAQIGTHYWGFGYYKYSLKYL